MNIGLFKLVSGEIIIGEYDADNIKQPYSVNVVPTERGSSNVIITPLMFPFETKESTVYVSISKTITTMNAPKELESNYLQQRSGLTLPKGKY